MKNSLRSKTLRSKGKRSRGYLLIEVAVSSALLATLLAGSVVVISDARARAAKASQRATAVAWAQSGLAEILQSPIDWHEEWGETSTQDSVYMGNNSLGNYPRVKSIVNNALVHENKAFSGVDYRQASTPFLRSDDSISEYWVAVKHLTWTGRDLSDDAQSDWVHVRGIRRNRVE